MALYKYLFVGLTSSSDLQPLLIGEERESQQGLQHHLPREQSPFFCQGLFISRVWWLAGIHQSKMWEDLIVELEFLVSMCRSLGWGGQEGGIGFHVSWFPCAQLWPALPKTLLMSVPERALTMQAWCYRTATSISDGKGAVVTIWIFPGLLSRVCYHLPK